MKKRFLFLIALGLMALGATAQDATTTYTVTCNASPIEGGSVMADPSSAAENAKITLQMGVNAGYRFVDASVVDWSESPVDIDKKTWTFTMPAANVTVTATFAKVYAVKQADGIVNGTLTISPTTAIKGEEVTITVDPDEGYQLTEGSLTVNNGAVSVKAGSGTNEYTFEMPDGDATVSAAFEKIKYAVAADANIQNGAIDVTSLAKWGETVSITIKPDAGYKLKDGSLKVNDGTNDVTINAGRAEDERAFIMPKAAVTISAEFEKETYTLTLPNVEGGSVTADKTSPVAWDEEVTLAVEPDEGYQLVDGSLTVKNGETSVAVSNNKFTMPEGNVVVSAAFEKIKYNVKVQAPAGVLTLSNVNPTSPVAWGEEVTATVKVAAGYVLQSVKAYQETVKGSKDVSTATEISVADALAKIEKMSKNEESSDYYLISGTVSNWSLSKQKGTFMLNDGEKSIKIYSVSYIDEKQFDTSNALAAGDKVKVYGKLENYKGTTPELLNGYVVEHSVAVAVTEGEGGAYSFEMPKANVNLEVEVKKLNAITLSILPDNEAGSATLSATSAIEGTEISISEIAAKDGYELGTVVAKQGDVDIELKDNKFTMPDGEVTVTVTFNKLYAISIDTEIANGEVKASKESAVKDSEIALTVTPAKGYQLVEGSLTVKNGEESVEVKDNKFTMPEADVKVSASFEKVSYTISVAEEIVGGKVEVEDALKTAQMGDSVALKATAADEFYTFSKYVVTCAEGDDKGEIVVKENGKFAMPAGNVLVSAEFAKVKFNITIAESENGAVEVAEKSVAWGEEVALTIKPADGYMLDSVVVKQGDTKVEVAGNKFTMPKGDVNIEAAFKAGVLVDKTFLNETFATEGDFTMNNVSMDESLSYVWKYNSDYKCMVASAFANKKAYAAESWLISPAINLSNATTATLTFDHAAKFQNGDWKEEFQLMVAKNPSETLDATEWTKLTIPTMPTKGSWTFVSSGEIDLSDYVGEENVRIAFRYVSTSSAADTWEVKNVKVAGKAISDGTDDGGDDSGEIATLDVTCTTVEAYNYEDYYKVGGESILMYIETEDENNGIQFEVITAEGTGIGENALPAGTYEIVDSESAAVGKVIAGEYWEDEEEDYEQYDGTWWFDYENEMSYSLVSGTVTITETDGVYTIVVDALTEDGGSVKATYTGAVEIKKGEYTALRDIEVMSDVYARDGRIYAEEGARIYTVTGIDVTTLNGQLDGVYVVKNGNKVAKVVVR
jgi:hypothetical protein